jgi:hypothetical protein
MTRIMGTDVDQDALSAMADRYFRKGKMVYYYEPERKYNGDMLLVRAAEAGFNRSQNLSMDNDYGLSKVSIRTKLANQQQLTDICLRLNTDCKWQCDDTSVRW